MNINGIHIYGARTEASIRAVREIAGAKVDAMPPIVNQFLYNTFNGGYVVERQAEDRWAVRTSLQHIELDVETPRRARLVAWGKHADRQANKPAIDRMIACAKE